MVLSRRYYREHKDVTRMLIFARADIRLGLVSARATDDAKLADAVRLRKRSAPCRDWRLAVAPAIVVSDIGLPNRTEIN